MTIIKNGAIAINEIKRIQRAIDCRALVRSMTARLDLQEANALLSESIEAIQDGNRDRAIDRLILARDCLAVVVSDLDAVDGFDRDAMYRLRDGLNATKGILVLYFS